MVYLVISVIIKKFPEIMNIDKDGMSWINVYGQSSFTKIRKKFKVNLNKSKELILKKFYLIIIVKNKLILYLKY